MSIENTIMGQIVKKAKIRWDRLTEKEAEDLIRNIKDGKVASSEVTYGSEIQAIKLISKFVGFNEEQVNQIIEDVYTKSYISEELSNQIKNKFEAYDKNKTIINILSEIHNQWVRNNSNKFGARHKDFQFVDLRLLPYSEVESDLLFLQEILEGCGIVVDNEELKTKFLEIQKQYIQSENIDSYSALVNKIMQGVSFYPSLEGLKTNKGEKDGEEFLIEDLLKDDLYLEEMTKQVEKAISPSLEKMNTNINHTRTDLHTHLNGAISSDIMANLALELLGKDIDPKTLEIIEDVNIFKGMKRAYHNRKQIIDELLEKGYGKRIIEVIAREYKKYGIEYVELTTDFNIIEKIKSGEIDISQIEKEYGVKMRFLLGLNRNNLNADAFNNETTQNLFVENPYLIGIDVQGDEVHGTELENCKYFLKTVAFYAHLNPQFLIRIHSGENNMDLNGIEKALQIIKEEANNYGEKYPRIRIGHAIHGINDRAIELMKEMNVAIELNIASNLKLRNIDSVQDMYLVNAIRLCEENDIPIFLGTDGYGVYQTTPEEQVDLAREAGIDFLRLKSNEEEYIKAQEEREKSQIEQVKFTNDKEALAKMRVEEKLKALGIRIIQGQNDSKLGGERNPKMPIVIAGGSLKTRSDGSFDEYRKVALLMQVLADIIKPGKCYFVTGGTDCGPEKLMHQAIKNSTLNTRCVGVIPSYCGKLDDSNALNDFANIRGETISDGFVVKTYNGWNDFAERLIEVANNQIKNSKNNRPKGCCIFIGGGSTVKSEITLALNGNSDMEAVPSFFFDGFGEESASKQAIKNLKCVTKFSDAESLITQMYNTYGSDIFINKFHIEDLPTYIESAKKRATLDYKLFYDVLIEEKKYDENQLNKIIEMIQNGRSEEIYEYYKKSNDLELFVSAYSTYYEERNGSESIKGFTEDLEWEKVTKAGEELGKSMDESFLGEEQTNGEI